MFSLTLLNSLLLLAARIYGAPAPQSYADFTCSEGVGYIDGTQSAPWQRPGDPTYGWKMQSAESVTSDEVDPGTLSATYSSGASVTITAGVNLGFNMPDDAGDFGFDFSVSYAVFTIKGWSANEPCPQGMPNAYVCGLSGLPWYVTITGTQTTVYSSGEFSNCLNPGSVVPGAKKIPFSFDAPVVKQAGALSAPGGGTLAYIQYSACWCENSYNTTSMSGLGPCPSPGCQGAT